MIPAAERATSTRLILVLAKGNNLITFTFPTLMKLLNYVDFDIRIISLL